MTVINNPTLESNIKTVTDWIVDECDDTRGEVKWLLEKLFAEQVEWGKEIDHVRTLNEDITNVYDGVFELEEIKKCESMERTIEQKKSIVVNLRCTQTDLGFDYGREVEDWMYSVEVDYQNHHKLDQDDWNVITKKEEE